MVERRLSTILAADIASYSRLMGDDEEDTLARLNQHRDIVGRLIDEHQGREFGTVGDSVMADFNSPVAAVRCAIAIQTALHAEESSRLPERAMRWRIGINLGDVMVKGPDLFGDGVNVAARLQTIAQPGSICVAEAVAEQVAQRITAKLDDLGKFRLKNIARPVRAFRISIGHEQLPVEPFRGLAPFDVEHAAIFFGRTRAVNETAERLQRQSRDGTAFLLIYGASGTGKSSLLRAGLIPALLAERPGDRSLTWRHTVLRPGDEGGPVRALLQALLEVEALPYGFQRSTDAITPAEIAQSVGTTLAAGQSHLVLAIDQLEELFTLPTGDPVEAQTFAATLAALARCSPVWVVATMRGDFYHRCAEIPELARIKDGYGSYELLPPTANEIGQIIREPALRAGLQFEASGEDGSLSDVILADAIGKHDVLPLLSFTLSALYERSRSTGLLTFADYRELGGLQGAVARWAEDVVERLPAAVADELPGVLRSLVALAPDRALTSRPAAAQSLASPLSRSELVNALVAARLLVVDEGSGGRKEVRLAHEALLTHWPSARQIIEEDWVLLFARTQLAVDVARWAEEERRPDLLLPPGRRLAEAHDLMELAPDELDANTRLFIGMSEEAAARAEQHRLTRMRTFAAAMALLAILAGGIGWLAWLERNDAERARQVAQAAEERALQARDIAEAARDRSQAALSRLLARRAVEAAHTGHQPDYALRVALAALPKAVADPHQGADTWQAAQALVEAMGSLRRVGFADPGLGSLRAEFSKDGEHFVFGTGTGAVQLWSTEPMVPRLNVQLSSERIWRVTLSLDGATLIGAGVDGFIYVVDVKTGERIKTLDPDSGSNYGVEFSPDGKIFATTSLAGKIHLWDFATFERIRTIDTEGGRIWTAAFSPDGGTILSASEDGIVRLFETASGSLMRSFEGHDKRVWQAAFHPSGELIASAGLDHTIRLWDAASGQQVALLEGHSDWVTTLTFSHDGDRLVSGGADSVAKLWDISSRAELAEFRGHTLRLWTADISPDDRLLLTTGHDGTLQLWNLKDQLPTAVLHDDRVAFRDSRYLPHENAVVTAGANGALRLWDLGDGIRATRLGRHIGSAEALAVMGEGRTMVSGGSSGILHLWDLPSRTKLLDIRGHENAIRELAVASDGEFLVSSDVGGDVLLWPLPMTTQHFRLPVDGNDMKAVDMAADGTTITASPLSGVQLWNPKGELIDAIRPDRAGPTISIEVGHGGKLLAAGRADHQVALWDLPSLLPRGLLKGHTAPVVDLAFSPDGQLLATASEDRTVRVWEAATGSALAILKGHGDGVNAVDFSAAGDALVTASDDGTARVWPIPRWTGFSELVAHAQTLAGSELTPTERRELALDD